MNFIKHAVSLQNVASSYFGDLSPVVYVSLYTTRSRVLPTMNVSLLNRLAAIQLNRSI